MASITSERLKELVEIYDKLKVRILRIDEKYSLDYVEPELDMPDSLNLTKLTYTPKTPRELRTLAEDQVAATVISKQATLDKNYNTKIKNFATQVAKLQIWAKDKLAVVDNAYSKELSDIKNRLINNGLIFSTVKDKYESQAKQDYKEKNKQINADLQNQYDIIQREQSDVEEVYNQSCKDLVKEKEALLNKAYQNLIEQEEALKRSIEKYNTGLDEKEAKYQASRARAYESARRAAYNRAYNNAKLYLQMGETGYRRMIEKEKYAVAQDAFYPLRRDEAKAILSMDSFLVTHLGTYYSAFVDWVNTVLIP